MHILPLLAGYHNTLVTPVGMPQRHPLTEDINADDREETDSRDIETSAFRISSHTLI